LRDIFFNIIIILYRKILFGFLFKELFFLSQLLLRIDLFLLLHFFRFLLIHLLELLIGGHLLLKQHLLLLF